MSLPELVAPINAVPLAPVLLALAAGASFGRLHLRQIALGAAGGTLLTAILMGTLGFQPPASGDMLSPLARFGFALFLYSVGFEAGPRFFAMAVRPAGWRFAAVALVTNLAAIGIAYATARLLEAPPAIATGILAGALTSAPTYAAAAHEQLDLDALSLAFAAAYPVGFATLVLAVQILPRLWKQDLARDALLASQTEARPGHPQGLSTPLTRVFEVSNAAIAGLPLRELHITARTGAVLTRRWHGPDLATPDGDTRLECGDRVLATGSKAALLELQNLLGPEIADESLESQLPPSRRIEVTRRDCDGQALSDLELTTRYHCLITAIERAGQTIRPDAASRLHVGDTVLVTGSRDSILDLARRLGRFEPDPGEVNFAVYALGILLGLGLGRVHWNPVGLDFTLGEPGGLLLAGLLLGWIARNLPRLAHIPETARRFVRDLGILLFVAETGLLAGQRLAGGARIDFAAVWTAAFLVTLLSVSVSALAARSLFRLRPVEAWGAVCGGMTSSAALTVIRRASDSEEVTHSYAAAYTIASLIATVAGQLLARALL